ncbi:DUF742 domain-containing protein [Streptomyces noursei]
MPFRKPDRALAPETDAPPPLAPRPYALTGGRTQARLEIAYESLVIVVPGSAQVGVADNVQPEHGAILARCATAPLSVAELSAHLCLPIGVVRVLVADLAALNRVRVTAKADGHPSAALMERVLSGLRQL